METKNKKRFKIVTSVIIVLILSFFGPMLVEDVDNGEIVVNQLPVSGEIKVWTEPGLKWQGGGEIERYDKAFQYWFGSNNEGSSKKIVFNDAGNGEILGSVRVLMPKDEASMDLIHSEFGSLEQLQVELIAPTVTKVIFATGPLLSSYESYAAKKNDLINYIDDQLKHGIYKTIQTETVVTDALTGEQKTVKRAELVESDDPEDFGFARQESAPFQTYNLDLRQLSVDDIIYEDRIMDQIQTQQNAIMAVQTSIAEAKEAEQNAIKEEALGKQSVAKARAQQLVEKEKAVVQAEQKREVAKLARDAAEFFKEEQILIGEGEAERKRLVMEADGALQQRLDAEVQIHKFYADAIKNYKGAWVPSIMMGQGGEGTGPSTALENILGMLSVESAQNMLSGMGGSAVRGDKN